MNNSIPNSPAGRCPTCDHPPIRLFVELVCAIETNAPSWYVFDYVKQLARHGYKIEPVCPADDVADTQARGWRFGLDSAGRDDSSVVRVQALIEDPPKSPASVASARHDTSSKAKADDPAKSRPPSLCGPGTALTVRGPDSPKTRL